MTKLNWSKFEPLFGTWASRIRPFFDSGGFDDIYSVLKKDSSEGKVIAPISVQTYRALIETPYDKVLGVICAMS